MGKDWKHWKDWRFQNRTEIFWESSKFSDSCTVNFPVIMPIDHNKTFVTSKEVFYSEDYKIE